MLRAPACSATIAAREQAVADVPEAGARRSAPRARPAPGSGARSPAGRCRRRRRAAPCRASGTTPSNQSRKNGRRSPARLRDLEDARAGRRARSTRRSSRERELEVGDVADAEADRRGVERAVRERQREQVALRPTRRPRDLRRARSSIRREKSSPVTTPPPARSAASARSPVPQQASSTRSPGRTTVGREPPPAPVEPGGHHAVHHVVDRRDPVEHRAHAVGRRPPASPACCRDAITRDTIVPTA